MEATCPVCENNASACTCEKRASGGCKGTTFRQALDSVDTRMKTSSAQITIESLHWIRQYLSSFIDGDLFGVRVYTAIQNTPKCKLSITIACGDVVLSTAIFDLESKADQSKAPWTGTYPDLYTDMYSDYAVDRFNATKAGASPARKKTLILLSNFCKSIYTEVTIRSSQSRNEIYIEYAVTPEPYCDCEDGCYQITSTEGRLFEDLSLENGIVPASETMRAYGFRTMQVEEQIVGEIWSNRIGRKYYKFVSVARTESGRDIQTPYVARLSVPLDPTLGKPYRRPPTARKRKSSDRDYNAELRALDSPNSQTVEEFKTVLISAKNMGSLGYILRPFGASGPLATLAPAAYSVLRKYMTILNGHPFHICLQKTKDELILRTQKPNGFVDAMALQAHWTDPS